jgi:hypothetical protein
MQHAVPSIMPIENVFCVEKNDGGGWTLSSQPADLMLPRRGFQACYILLTRCWACIEHVYNHNVTLLLDTTMNQCETSHVL